MTVEDIRLTSVDGCPACGGHGPVAFAGLTDRLLGVEGSWSLRRCESCHSLWMDPRPVDEDLHRGYPDLYFTHDAARPTPDRAPWKQRLRGEVLRAPRFGYGPPPGPVAGMLAAIPPLRNRATHQLSALFPPWTRGGRLLDVGCGNGDYLALMRGHGWTVAGVENDPAAAATARERHGLEIAASLEDASLDGSFDVVTMSHVLEHVPDPASFLRTAASALRPGGKLLAITPNGSALGLRWFGRDWYALDPPRHLVLFTPAGLRTTLGRVPDLAVARIGTTSKIAQKVARERARARRWGRFRSGGLNTFQGRVLPAGFAVLERAAMLVRPWGEELELEARKR